MNAIAKIDTEVADYTWLQARRRQTARDHIHPPSVNPGSR